MEVKKIRTRENPVVRRALIVDEAIRVIGERGYNGFTVQALAERCGLSNAGLLHYFESKDNLLICLLDEIERREMEAVSPVLEEGLAALESGIAPQLTIFRTLREIGTSFAKNPEIGRFITVLLAESLDPDHPAHGWFKMVEVETIGIFSKLVAPIVPDPLSKAMQLLAAMHGFQMQWFRSGQGFEIVPTWEAALCDLLPLGSPQELHLQARAATI